MSQCADEGRHARTSQPGCLMSSKNLLHRVCRVGATGHQKRYRI